MRKVKLNYLRVGPLSNYTLARVFVWQVRLRSEMSTFKLIRGRNYSVMMEHGVN